LDPCYDDNDDDDDDDNNNKFPVFFFGRIDICQSSTFNSAALH